MLFIWRGVGCEEWTSVFCGGGKGWNFVGPLVDQKTTKPFERQAE